MTVPMQSGGPQSADSIDSAPKQPGSHTASSANAHGTESRSPAGKTSRKRARSNRSSRGQRGGQTDGYLASANLAEEPGEEEEQKPQSQFASPFTASYLDYMDGNNRRGNYGGMNRLDYFIGGLTAGVFIAIAVVFAIHMESTIMLGLFMLASVCAQLWLGSERCMNLGLDGPWCLALLIPCIGPIFGIVLSIAPEGYADHKKMDTTGYILLVVFLFGIPAIGLFIAAASIAAGGM